MFHLSACNRGLFEESDCYILFFPFKEPFKIYEKCFLFHITISLKKNLLVQGRSEAPSDQAFEGVKFIIKLFQNFPHKFFYVQLLIFENVIPQTPLSAIYQTRVSFFWLTRYTQRKINTC